jgi:RNA polymerase sigma-70 factor (ECF subfamily)
VDLEEIFRAHQRSVFAYFLRMAGSRADAEELTQETFARACSAAQRFRGDSKPRTWLFGIARRVLLEASRAGLFERRSELPADLPDSEGTPIEERLDLERAFSSLGLSDREALLMVDVLGFEPIEVAGLLEITPAAFRVRLHRARGRLREVYGS